MLEMLCEQNWAAFQDLPLQFYHLEAIAQNAAMADPRPESTLKLMLMGGKVEPATYRIFLLTRHLFLCLQGWDSNWKTLKYCAI